MSDSERIEIVRATVAEGRLADLRYRQRQLRSLHSTLVSSTSELVTTLQEADGLTQAEAQIVVAKALDEVRHHYDGLDLKTQLKNDYKVKLGNSNEERRVAYGLAYYIPEPSMLVHSVMSVVSCAIEAGTCCIIELKNRLSPAVGIVKSCISKALDPECFTIVSTRPSAELLKECLLVDQAGEDLQIETLGKLFSPSNTAEIIGLVDRTADIKTAAKELAFARTGLGGQSAQAVDTIMVNEFVAELLIQAISDELALSKDPSQNGSVTSNGSARQTAHSQEASVRKSTLHSLGAGSKSIVLNDDLASIVKVDGSSFRGKVRGKVFAIRTFRSLDHAIDMINQPGQALKGLYVFAGQSEATYLSRFISTRATFVNGIPRGIFLGAGGPDGHVVKSFPRYRREMFETPSPQYIVKAARHGSDAAVAEKFLSAACQPLKPMGQAKPGQSDFFMVGFFLGAAVYILPAIAVGIGGIGWAVSKGYTRLRS